LYFLEVPAELGIEEMTAEPAGLDASVETAEHVCQEVRSLLAKVHSTLDRVCDVSAPESTRTTMACILEALAPREGGEDPLITVVRRQVTIGSESVFSMMMMHGVKCDFDKVTGTYPKDKDGRDKSPKDYSSGIGRYLSTSRNSWWIGMQGRRLPGSRGAVPRVHRLVGLRVV
jgi:hypothetical protein